MAFASNLNDLENYFLQGKWIIANERKSCIEYKFMEVYRKIFKRNSISKFNTYPDVEGINSNDKHIQCLWEMGYKKYIIEVGVF